jgi:hypothetical protein
MDPFVGMTNHQVLNQVEIKRGMTLPAPATKDRVPHPSRFLRRVGYHGSQTTRSPPVSLGAQWRDPQFHCPDRKIKGSVQRNFQAFRRSRASCSAVARTAAIIDSSCAVSRSRVLGIDELIAAETCPLGPKIGVQKQMPS